MLLGKCVLKICSKFTGENPCRSAISVKLLQETVDLFTFTEEIRSGKLHFMCSDREWKYNLRKVEDPVKYL